MLKELLIEPFQKSMAIACLFVEAVVFEILLEVR